MSLLAQLNQQARTPAAGTALPGALAGRPMPGQAIPARPLPGRPMPGQPLPARTHAAGGRPPAAAPAAEAPAGNHASMAPDLFASLRTFIYDKTGIYFQDHKQYLLESRITRRLAPLGLADYDGYLSFLRSAQGTQELPNLVNAITINETFFFRNEPQFEVIENEIIPALVQARMADGTRRIRLWSAASSTGDEPYSLALIVKERLQPRYPNIRFEIFGTDIDTDVLGVARAGMYSDYAVRNIPPAMMQKYFRKNGARHELSPEIRRMVQFKQANLVDRRAMMAMRGIDLILCANVLIYFDDKSKRHAVSLLYNSLNRGGYLMVGFSETLYGVTQAFQPARFAKTIAYQKA